MRCVAHFGMHHTDGRSFSNGYGINTLQKRPLSEHYVNIRKMFCA